MKEINESAVKKVLEKQLEILSERSKCEEVAYLAPITEQMIRLAKALDPALRIQSFAEDLNCLPAATLSMSDLEEITAARKERLRQADKEFRRLLDEHRKTIQDPPPESANTPTR